LSAVVCGAWPSMLMPLIVLPVLTLPATSAARAGEALVGAVALEHHVAGAGGHPEPALPSARDGSAQVKPAVTSPRYQPALFRREGRR